MPTELYDCHQDWWHVSEMSLQNTGQLANYEQAQIKPRVVTSKLPSASLHRHLTKFLKLLSSNEAHIFVPVKNQISSFG